MIILHQDRYSGLRGRVVYWWFGRSFYVSRVGTGAALAEAELRYGPFISNCGTLMGRM